MIVKELIEELKKYDENLEIHIIGRDEYYCEIEGLKFKSLEQSDMFQWLYINV